MSAEHPVHHRRVDYASLSSGLLPDGDADGYGCAAMYDDVFDGVCDEYGYCFG